MMAWSYKFLAFCDYPILEGNGEGKINLHCGKPATAEVTEVNGEKWTICQEHLDFILKASLVEALEVK